MGWQRSYVAADAAQEINSVDDNSLDGKIPVDVACAAVMRAVADRRNNGGTRKKIKAAALELLSSICNELD